MISDYNACTGAGRGADLDLALVYDHLAFAEYKSGNFKRAAQYTKDLLQNGREGGANCKKVGGAGAKSNLKSADVSLFRAYP